jgi:hypothetical protein
VMTNTWATAVKFTAAAVLIASGSVTQVGRRPDSAGSVHDTDGHSRAK